MNAVCEYIDTRTLVADIKMLRCGVVRWQLSGRRV